MPLATRRETQVLFACPSLAKQLFFFSLAPSAWMRLTFCFWTTSDGDHPLPACWRWLLLLLLLRTAVWTVFWPRACGLQRLQPNVGPSHNCRVLLFRHTPSHDCKFSQPFEVIFSLLRLLSNRYQCCHFLFIYLSSLLLFFFLSYICLFIQQRFRFVIKSWKKALYLCALCLSLSLL